MPARPSWHVRLDPGDLADGDVHVWRADLRRQQSALPTLTNTLSPDELARAGRFRRARDRRRYLFARGVLRSILARYLRRAPAELSFRYGRTGKPRCEGNPVRFNLSHAGDLVVCAVTRARDVGIDVERVRPGLDTLMRWLWAGAAARRREFFRGWTRLEALAKAQGSVPTLDRPSFTALLIDDPGRHWWLRDFIPRGGYVATVATRGSREPQVAFGQWTCSR